MRWWSGLARRRSNNPPVAVKTDGLASYRDAMPRAFPTHRVRHVISKGVKADINNNLSERLQGTIRDRDKTLRGLKARDTGQAYVDGLVTPYNPVYFRPYESLKGKKPAEAAGAEIPLIAGRMWRRCNPAKGAGYAGKSVAGYRTGERRLRRGVAGVAARGLNPASPPYDGMREYGGYNGAFDFDAIAAVCVANLAPGEALVWVVADQIVDGDVSGTSFTHALGFKRLGLKLHQPLIFYKWSLAAMMLVN